MKLHALGIPENPADLPHWLERQLVGAHLGELVAELTAVHGSLSTLQTLDDVLGEDRERAIRNGLKAVPVAKLRRLLVQPQLLLELQEAVCRDGGPLWSRLAAADDGLTRAAASSRSRVEQQLVARRKVSLPPRAEVVPISRASHWTSRPWFVSFATAAAVLLAVALFEIRRERAKPSPSVAAGWGWTRPDLLAADGSADRYLSRLADAAEEWFDKRPDDSIALSRRIAELRQGCSVLILGKHEPLDQADRQWLVEKCRAWAAKLDQHVLSLEAGDDPLDVRDRVDETVRKLVEAMRNRAVERA